MAIDISCLLIITTAVATPHKSQKYNVADQQQIEDHRRLVKNRVEHIRWDLGEKRREGG